jgi:hypothetical protein
VYLVNGVVVSVFPAPKNNRVHKITCFSFELVSRMNTKDLSWFGHLLVR